MARTELAYATQEGVRWVGTFSFGHLDFLLEVFDRYRRVVYVFDAHVVIPWVGQTIRVDMTVNVDDEPTDTVVVNGDVREQHMVDNAAGVNFFEPLQVVFGRSHVMVTPNQSFVPIQPIKDCFRQLLVHCQIAEMVDLILRAHHRIPVLNQHLVHVVYIFEFTQRRAVLTLEREDVGVVEMRIGDDEDVRHYSSRL